MGSIAHTLMRREEDKVNRMYLSWKKRCGKRIPGISAANSKIILQYIHDMEFGLNVGKSSKKGGRSYNRLYNLQQRLVFLTKKFEKHYGVKGLTKLEEQDLHKFFTGMRKGDIRRLDGKIYQDPAYYVKVVKAFWHWWQKVNRKKGIHLYDITCDLDTSKNKPKWVYLTEEEVKKLHDKAIYYYKVLIMFLYDTGVRAPSELRNIKVSDLHNDCKELMIRDEIKELMKKNLKCKLFCVGDDWQSIMGFTGSNLDFFVNFDTYFPHPERTDLNVNYRSIKSVVDTGAEIIRNNHKQLKKEARAHNQTQHKVTVYSSLFANKNSDDIKRYYDQVAEHCIHEIKNLHDNEGYEWGDIMILRRIKPPANWMSLALQREAIKQKVPLSEDVHNPTTVSDLSVHKSKGLQSRVVFILNLDKGLYGFPNELQNPDILEPATKGAKGDQEEEERRLFYVAVTRAKEDVMIYHQKCSRSKFLDEIKSHVVEKKI